MAFLISQWHCDECEDIFYSELEREPEFCPYCRANQLSDSKVLEAKPLVFNIVSIAPINENKNKEV